MQGKLINKIGLFLFTLFAVSFASYLVLHGLYHPHLVLVAMKKTWSLVSPYLPGSDLFHITYSPLLLFIASVSFWYYATQKNAWGKFKKHSKWFIRNVLGQVSFTTCVTGLLVLSFSLLYRDLQDGSALENIWNTLLGFQITLYLWFRCIRAYTLPWLRYQYKQQISVLRAKNAILSGENYVESREAFIAAIKRKEESSWSKHLH